jgi:hypothetical protein
LQFIEKRKIFFKKPFVETVCKYVQAKKMHDDDVMIAGMAIACDALLYASCTTIMLMLDDIKGRRELLSGASRCLEERNKIVVALTCRAQLQSAACTTTEWLGDAACTLECSTSANDQEK